MFPLNPTCPLEHLEGFREFWRKFRSREDRLYAAKSPPPPFNKTRQIFAFYTKLQQSRFEVYTIKPFNSNQRHHTAFRDSPQECPCRSHITSHILVED